MKILIVNLHSSRNAGDDVLTQVTVSQLQQAFVLPEITLAMNDPASYHGPGTTVGSFMTWFQRGNAPGSFWKLLTAPWLLLMVLVPAVSYRLAGAKIMWGFNAARQALLQAYLEADLVVSSAGNFLYSSGRGSSLLISLWTIKFAMLCGKPVYMMPQTVGPLNRSWERRLTASVLSQMRLCFVRDDISKLELMKMKAWSKRCYLVPDLAFVFPALPASTGQAVLTKAGVDLQADGPLLGITLINWAAQNKAFQQQDQYETAVAAAVRHFVENYDGRVILFAQVRGPTWAEDDLVPAKRVKERVSQLGNNVLLFDQELSALQLKAAYGQMDLFIGSRLHSNIFALSEGVPALFIQYQYKTRGVAKMLDLEEWVLTIEAAEPEQLIKRLDRLVEQQASLRQKIQRNLEVVRQQAAQVTRQIATDFESLS